MTQAPHRFSVAPMMDWTDRHCRSFHRVLTRRALLYSEMVTSAAVLHGDRQRLLSFDAAEHPVALQLGGSDPAELAAAARIGEDFGYREINLNVGCPSDREQSGRFGACLMLEPGLVAECMAAIRQVVQVPATVKCRIGVDDDDSYEQLRHFIDVVSSEGGVRHFIVHARKAILNRQPPTNSSSSSDRISSNRTSSSPESEQEYPSRSSIMPGMLMLGLEKKVGDPTRKVF